MKDEKTILNTQEQIDIRAIEQAITELWRSAAQGDDQQATVTRTCVLNLLVILHNGLDVTDIIAALTDDFPSRAIVINVEPADTDQDQPGLEAWVQAHCQIPTPGRPHMCCEQISIIARGSSIEQVPGTILPLLVPDVPVVLWYPYGDPFHDPLFERLSSMADRAIVDTKTFPDQHEGLRRMAARVGQEPAISDLTWGRITLWREQIAQSFDSLALMPQLHAVSKVEIRHTPKAQTQALLILGWLASRLEWKPQAGGFGAQGGTLQMARNNDNLEATLGPYPAHADNRRSASVKIICETVTVQVTHDEHDLLLTRIEAAGKPAIQRGVPWKIANLVALLAAELRLPGHDKPYIEALQAATQLLVDE